VAQFTAAPRTILNPSFDGNCEEEQDDCAVGFSRDRTAD
jgi:hypothetical protein